MNIKQIWHITDDMALQVCPKCYISLVHTLPIENLDLNVFAKSIASNTKVPDVLAVAYENYKNSFKRNTGLDIELDYITGRGHLWKITNAVAKTQQAIVFEKQYGAMEYTTEIEDD